MNQAPHRVSRYLVSCLLCLLILATASGQDQPRATPPPISQASGFEAQPPAPRVVPLPPIEVPALPQAPDPFPGPRPQAFIPGSPFPLQTLQVIIDPKTPTKDLLPAAPRGTTRNGPILTDDLTQVPEIEFAAALAHDRPTEAAQTLARMIAGINHVNGRKHDAFMEALRAARPDLAALPMALGDACRTRGERNGHFAQAVAHVRAANPAHAAEVFWPQYTTNCIPLDRTLAAGEKGVRDHALAARIAALMQMLAPTPTNTRLGLVKYLATLSHVDATKAIARLALFSPEEEIRTAAVEALKVRREKDYTDVLMQALRYPWPAVAKRASEMLVKLERTDVVSQLLDALAEADPRSPTTQGGRTVVRELVRINHNRNCLLCHAPGNSPGLTGETLTAGVPVPGTPLSPPQQGYGNAPPELLVRLDVTYLRQDFSALQPVADAGPWPEMQRFDFVVRTRTVTAEEAKEYRENLTPREAGQQTPYRRAILAALRELTGKDTAPTPEAWRKLLGISAAASP